MRQNAEAVAVAFVVFVAWMAQMKLAGNQAALEWGMLSLVVGMAAGGIRIILDAVSG